MLGANLSKGLTLTVAALIVALTSTAFLVGRSLAVGAPSDSPLIYSGTLEDANGARISGMRNVEIKLWGVGSTPLCTTPSQPIALENGHFSVPLDAGCVEAVNAERNAEVEVLINGGTLGRAKLGAVPYALRADRAERAASADTAAGALAEKISALEGSAVSIRWQTIGWLQPFRSCKPLNDYALDGGTNILVRASIFTDAECNVSGSNPNDCHTFCAAVAFRSRSPLTSCCKGVTEYYTDGLIESLLIKPELEE